MCRPAALPKTTKSNKEFPPNLLAPCTDTFAASPIEYNPSITESVPFFVVITWPCTFVGIPPII